MSEFSLILVLQKKQENPTKTWQRYKLNLRDSLLLGGLFSIMEQFDSTLSSVIDSTLGLRLDAQIVVQQTEIGLRIVDERARTDHHRADVRHREPAYL